MSFDAEYEYGIMAQRILLIEEVLNKVQTAITNLATLEQLRQIVLLKQKDLDALDEDITTLTNKVNLIYNEVFK